MKSAVFVIFLSFVSVLEVANCSTQGLAVRGSLFCGRKPATNIEVKLQDLDMIRDDDMDTQHTDEYGNFHLQGDTEESGSITPILKIKHKCNAKCEREFTFEIPQYYVNSRDTANLGELNLEAMIPRKDKRRC